MTGASQPPAGLAERLASGTVLGAEGYVFELERRGYIKAGPFVPEVVLDHPEAVRELHREFLRAGADVMVALTYYAHREKLRDVGREGDLEAMNRSAVRLAREVAAEGDALVAGNVCNTWIYDPDDPSSSQAVRATYAEQLGWAVDEGIDFVISETNDYLGEALIALEVIGALGLPAVVTLASTQPDRTRDGYPYAEACRILAAEGATVVGLNCDRGPATMLPLLAQIRAAVDGPIAAQPVPYRTGAAAPTWSRCARRACAPSRSRWSRSAVPGSRWPSSRWTPASSASATPVSAAAPDRITSGPWPRRWAGRCRRAGTRRPWTCTRCTGPMPRPGTRRSWTPGARNGTPAPGGPRYRHAAAVRPAGAARAAVVGPGSRRPGHGSATTGAPPVSPFR